MITAATLKYAVAWLVLTILFAALTGGLNWLTYWKLVHRSVLTHGTVIQVLPEMHATVRYRYYADGREYQGQTQPRQPNPPIERLAEGAPLTVWYDPAEPRISVVGLPSTLLENETISVLSVAVLLPTLILLVWRYRMLSRYRLLWCRLRRQ
jgi:Protein of unknown function (DUF3592)